jgi:hypothetical protein
VSGDGATVIRLAPNRFLWQWFPAARRPLYGALSALRPVGAPCWE